jgi:hypothetical protein
VISEHTVFRAKALAPDCFSYWRRLDQFSGRSSTMTSSWRAAAIFPRDPINLAAGGSENGRYVQTRAHRRAR